MDDAHPQLEALRRALAERDAENARLAAEVTRLTELVAELERRLGLDSSNSSKPPSSDAPASRNQRKQARKDRKKGRNRGGQKGHQGHRRELLPESEVDEFVDLCPELCENCWEPLPQVADPYAKRIQVTELPPIKPHTTEFRGHKVKCACCGHRTRAKLDERVPQTAFGPRLSALIALLTGVYHLSRRKTTELLSDVLGIGISLCGLSNVEARVSEAVRPAFDEAWARVGWGSSSNGMPQRSCATSAVDRERRPGRFLLTGSASLLPDHLGDRTAPRPGGAHARDGPGRAQAPQPARAGRHHDHRASAARQRRRAAVPRAGLRGERLPRQARAGSAPPRAQDERGRHERVHARQRFHRLGEKRLKGKAAVDLLAGGRLRVRASSTDIGQGTETVFAQIAAAVRLREMCSSRRQPWSIW